MSPPPGTTVCVANPAAHSWGVGPKQTSRPGPPASAGSPGEGGADDAGTAEGAGFGRGAAVEHAPVDHTTAARTATAANLPGVRTPTGQRLHRVGVGAPAGIA